MLFSSLFVFWVEKKVKKKKRSRVLKVTNFILKQTINQNSICGRFVLYISNFIFYKNQYFTNTKLEKIN